MKNLRKAIYIIFVVVLILVIILYGGFLGAGNYGYAQQYKFNVDEHALFEKVQKFKNENPECNIPGSKRGMSDSFEPGKYSSVYLFYPDEKEIVHMVIFSSPGNHSQSVISLDAINNGLIPGNWKTVNKDFDREENLAVKREFRERILEKLDLIYTDDGNNMYVFWK